MYKIYKLLPDSYKVIIRKIITPLIYMILAKIWVSWVWKWKFGESLNLRNPVTYNERIQWLKVYGERRPDVFGDVTLAKKCADKLGVREYVAETIGEQYLYTLLGVYDRLEDIPFTELPDQFVIKATHDSGSVVIVNDKNNIPKEKLQFIKYRLGVNYGRLQKEWVYKDIIPKIIVEKLISADHKDTLWDYKVFTFKGVPRLIQVDVDRFENHKRCFYTVDWIKTDLAVGYPIYEGEIPRPSLLLEMLEKSALLAQPFRHVRVDWYCLEDRRLIFGELTFFPDSGLGRFNLRNWEELMGEGLAW